MNEQLQQSLVQIIEKASAGVDAGTAFLSQQLPDVVEQLLVFKMAENAVGLVFGIVLVVICFFMGRTGAANYRKEKQKNCLAFEDGPVVLPFIACGISAFIGGIVTFCSFTEILKIWIAPKIYLIEYAASLTK